MAKTHEEISPKLAAWLERQRLFFVATAPLSPDGHINVSPKGDLRWFRILGPNRVAYLDFVGSGAETIAHAKENGRIVLMFCAFEGPPRIVRLHGRARAVLGDDPEFAGLRALFEESSDAVRAVIVADVARVGDSCGYGVPIMRFDGMRTQYDAWVDKKVRDGGLDDYITEHNTESIDGLPAV